MTRGHGSNDDRTNQPAQLHLSMRPLSSRQSNDRRSSPWAIFGWGMVALAAAAVLFVVMALMVFMNSGPPPGP